MRSALTQMSTKLGITDVRDVQVGEVVDDGAGGFVRVIEIPKVGSDMRGSP